MCAELSANETPFIHMTGNYSLINFKPPKSVSDLGSNPANPGRFISYV